MLCGPDGELPEKLRNLEPRLIEHVSNEIMDKDPNVRWNDIGSSAMIASFWFLNFFFDVLGVNWCNIHHLIDEL